MKFSKLTIPIVLFSMIVLSTFTSCRQPSGATNEAELQDSIAILVDTTDNIKLKSFNPDSSLILLSREEYRTYSDHFAYLSDEEYFDVEHLRESHLDDTISIGFRDNDERIGLVDSLKLNTEWLCICFPSQETETPAKVIRAKTKSYSLNDVIDFVPITLLSFANEEQTEELRSCDIAFRGSYTEFDFELLNQKSVSAKEQADVVNVIQTYVRNKNVIPPRPMSTDTLLLDNISKLTDNTVVAKYKTTWLSDSDGDYGNTSIFIVQNNKVLKWLAGMDGDYHGFRLRNNLYIYVGMYTYATGRTNLFKMTDDGLKGVYDYVIFGD